MYLHTLKIGNVELKNNLILAPMAGITDLPFRAICKKFEPGLVVTEMASSKAIFYDDDKTKLLMEINQEERPISVQIFGSDPETMGYAAKYVSNFADIIDINMGCPAPKVVKNGDGSKMLLDLDNARNVIREVVKNSTKPVTVKIRLGWDSNNIVAREIATIAEECGVSAITVHGRTREQYYSGKADLDMIKEVKQSVKIPVIGNGDIHDEESAKYMLEYTGVDGIMIGRAAIGNPWLFKRIQYFLETGNKLQEESLEEKLKVIEEHINLEEKFKGEYIAVREMRKHIAAYTKNLPNSSEFRSKLNLLDKNEDVLNELKAYFNNLMNRSV